jgi:hypothetical protein
MKRLLLSCSAFLFLIFQGKAQSEIKPFVDTTSTFEHFFGLQANQLLQQVFNFGEADAVNNPYLAKYTFKHIPTGLALNVGGGFDRNSSETEDGILNENESYDVRIGPGWQTPLGKRFELGVGADVIFGRSYGESSSVSTVVLGGNLDSTITTNRAETTYFGGGLQLSLNFKLSPSVMIGTEASWYAFRTESKTNDILDNYTIIQNGDEEIVLRGFDNQNSTSDGDELDFNLPIAIFLLIRI